jgi:hypothetical protein
MECDKWKGPYTPELDGLKFFLEHTYILLYREDVQYNFFWHLSTHSKLRRAKVAPPVR